MRTSRTRWSAKEEAALRAGVDRFGVGRWAEIRASECLALRGRTAVDLKDKWRNLQRKAQRDGSQLVESRPTDRPRLPQEQAAAAMRLAPRTPLAAAARPALGHAHVTSRPLPGLPPPATPAFASAIVPSRPLPARPTGLPARPHGLPAPGRAASAGSRAPTGSGEGASVVGTFRSVCTGYTRYSGRLDERTAQRLSLRREPKNPFDRSALQVRTEAGAMLGHVSAADAAKLAPLIDGGRIKVSARSRAAHSDVCGRAFDVRIKVRVASTCPFLTVDDAHTVEACLLFCTGASAGLRDFGLMRPTKSACAPQKLRKTSRQTGPVAAPYKVEPIVRCPQTRTRQP